MWPWAKAGADDRAATAMAVANRYFFIGRISPFLRARLFVRAAGQVGRFPSTLKLVCGRAGNSGRGVTRPPQALNKT
jgi:hypothetical protein